MYNFNLSKNTETNIIQFNGRKSYFTKHILLKDRYEYLIIKVQNLMHVHIYQKKVYI